MIKCIRSGITGMSMLTGILMAEGSLMYSLRRQIQETGLKTPEFSACNVLERSGMYFPRDEFFFAVEGYGQVIEAYDKVKDRCSEVLTTYSDAIVQHNVSIFSASSEEVLVSAIGVGITCASIYGMFKAMNMKSSNKKSLEKTVEKEE